MSKPNDDLSTGTESPGADADWLTAAIVAMEAEIVSLKRLETQMLHMGTDRMSRDAMGAFHWLVSQRLRPTRMRLEGIVLELKRPQRQRARTKRLLATSGAKVPNGTGNPVL